MSDEIQEHQRKLIAAFSALLNGEDAVADVKRRRDESEAMFRSELAAAEAICAEAWSAIKALMAETGEVEVLLPGQVTDFKIGYGPARVSVKVDDPEAVPDEYCKIERKPKLKEIAEHLKAVGENARPNWARLEQSEPKLGWKAVKKNA